MYVFIITPKAMPKGRKHGQHTYNIIYIYILFTRNKDTPVKHPGFTRFQHLFGQATQSKSEVSLSAWTQGASPACTICVPCIMRH